ncbi:fimbrial biogenesis chaperone [Pseudomonas sp. RT6P73]
MTCLRRMMTGFLLVSVWGASAALEEANAGVMAQSTRVIYLEGQKERTLMVANTNAYPVLVQVWVNRGEETLAPQSTLTPMIVLPPVFRLQPGALQGVRLMFNGDPLPGDRESVFWLNLYEVPPTRAKAPSMAAKIAVAMNTQMKVFYRPKALATTVNDLGSALRFGLQKSASTSCLMVRNPTPYHVSFASLGLLKRGQELLVSPAHDMMTPPLSERCYALPQVHSFEAPNSQVRFTLIDDAGHAREGTAPMSLSLPQVGDED